MGWSEYARSKTPLKLVFILIAAILVNSIIIEGIRLISLYDYKAPIDITVLSQMNGEYENAVILDTAQDDAEANPLWEDSHTAYLLETESGERKLAIVDKHFLFDRYRYLKKFSVDVPHIPEQEDWQSVTSGTLHHQALIWIRDWSTIESFSMGQNYGPGIYLALIPMILVEYLAYIFIFKRDELL